MKPTLRLRMADISLSLRRLTSLPLRRYVPPSKTSSSPAMLRNVVLPEPDGPMTETNSPASTVSESPSSACVSTSSVRYTLRMAFISSMRSSPLMKDHGLCVAERGGVGHDDPFPFFQSAHDFDFGCADGARFDGAPRGAVAVDDVRAPAAAAFEEGAARDFEHVVLRLEDEPRRHALVLLHPLRPAAVGHRTRRDLIADDFRRDSGDVSLLLSRAVADRHRSSDLRIGRVL